jgi:hypothetical protein
MVDFASLFSTGLGPVGWQQVALSLLLAFLLGKLVSVTYDRTHFGLSYSLSFSQSLVLGAVVSSTLMMAIGDNLARGLGILGTMALVRFRTNIPESRDMIFVFAALAVGIAAGVRSFHVAVTGALGFCAAAHFLQRQSSERARRFDGMVRFWAGRDESIWQQVQSVLQTHCDGFVLVAMREIEQGESTEYSYQFKLRRSARRDDFFRGLESIPGAGGVTFLLEEAHTEL